MPDSKIETACATASGAAPKRSLIRRFLASAIALCAGSHASALAPGQSIPDVSAKNQDGALVRLSNLKGKYVLVYFYPMDDTPGCTTEAQELRDRHGELLKLGAVVFGASKQNEASHRKFRDKHRLPFDLLTDPEGSLAQALGASLMPGIGLNKRQSVLIGPDGKVVRFYADVVPAKHAQEVIAAIKEDLARRPQ